MSLSSMFIPLVSSMSGSALTAADWKKINLNTLAVEFETLLVKPGVKVLQTISSLKDYFGGPQQIILNAFSLKGDAEKIVIRSPYDGQQLQFSFAALTTLINQLKPDGLILPRHAYTKIQNELATDIPVFLPFDDLITVQAPEKCLGLYFDSSLSCDEIAQKRTQFPHVACYTSTSDCSLSTLKILKSFNIQYIESDQPAQDAVHGIIYTLNQQQTLLSSQYENQHEIINSTCLCEGCQQQLTYAYFHHLYQQTPGLCHRFLTQHNAYCCSTIINDHS